MNKLKENVLKTLIYDMFVHACAFELKDGSVAYAHRYIKVYVDAQKILIDAGFIKATDCYYLS